MIKLTRNEIQKYSMHLLKSTRVEITKNICNNELNNGLKRIYHQHTSNTWNNFTRINLSRDIQPSYFTIHFHNNEINNPIINNTHGIDFRLSKLKNYIKFLPENSLQLISSLKQSIDFTKKNTEPIPDFKSESKSVSENSVDKEREESDYFQQNFKDHILIYTAPPFPAYKKVVTWNVIKLGLNMTISVIGSISTFFLGGSTLTLVMALAPILYIYSSSNILRQSLKEIKRIYYIKENDKEYLKLVLFREDNKGNPLIHTLNISEDNSQTYFRNTKNHYLDIYPMSWNFGNTSYRLDSHGVLHLQNIELCKRLFFSQDTWKSVFNVSKNDMDAYGFVKIAPDTQLAGQLSWKKKWHVIVDNEIHLLLMKPYETYYAIDAFCHQNHPMSEGKILTNVNFHEEKDKLSSKKSMTKDRSIKCSSCPKPGTIIDLQSSTLPVRIIDGWVSIRLDTVYRDINGGRSNFAYTLRNEMTLEEFLSFYSIYK